MTLSTPRKILLALAVALVAVYVAHATLVQRKTPLAAANAGRQVPVRIAAAEQSDVDVALDIIGRVEAFSTVTVRARVGGQLESLQFTPGQRVAKGQVVARLDTSLLAAQLKQAQGTLARDEALLEKARADEKRYDEVAARGFVSKADLDTYRANRGVAEATVKADRAAVELAQTQLGYATITAPFDGVAGAPLVYPGAIIAADVTDIVVINQTEPVHVAFALPEASLPAVRAAQSEREVAISARAPGDEGPAQSGTLDFIDNAVDAGTGTILLKARFDNADGKLTPGQFLNVTLPTTRLSGAVLVPVEALQNSPSGPFLFVLKADDSVEQRPITTGATIGKRLVVAGGLKPGERVVTEGQLLLVPGTRVTYGKG